MKTKIKIIAIAILVFLAIFVVIQFFSPDKYISRLFTKTGTLSVESIPKTNVFLSNNLVGQTPLQTNIKAGVYTIKLVPEVTQASLIPYSATVRVFQGTTTYVNHELATKDLQSAGEILSLEESGSTKAQIWVNTDPPGVFVSLDGQDRGVSPVFMDNVSDGSHDLSVRGDGFIARSVKVNAVNGYKLNADFKLMIDENYQKPANDKKKEKDKKVKKAEKLLILDTPTGWLRVREAPNLSASESAQVKPGDEFIYFEEQSNWYQIEYEEDKLGWVFGDYVELVDDTDSSD
jgi:hypothetical protein